MSVEAKVNERLAALTAAGTSVWLDQIRRSLITSGELERLVREDSLRGVTSNPAIFEKAILGSSDYDEQVAELPPRACRRARSTTRSPSSTSARVRRAAPVWEEASTPTASSRSRWSRRSRTTPTARSRRRASTGPRSAPEPADQDPGHRGGAGDRGGDRRRDQRERDAAVLGRGLHRDRRGVHPRDGAPARRRRVARRALGGELLRLARGHGGRQAAGGLGSREKLFGIAAVANARAAYVRFKELFLAEARRLRGFRAIASRLRGCPVQRPLWASTGVKDPRYPETKYVDTLVAPHTVNTMPMPTLLACAEELEVTGAADQDPTDLQKLADAGIDMGDVTDKLLRAGSTSSWSPSTRSSEASSSRARGSSRGGRRRSLAPGRARAAADRVHQRAQSRSGEAGLAARRVALGRPGRPRDRQPARLARSARRCSSTRELHEFAAAAKADGLEHAVLLGMGGSSLGPEVIRRSYGDVPDGLSCRCSTRPIPAPCSRRSVDLDKTRGLLEVGRHDRDALAHALLLRARGARRLALCAVTDPGSPLVELARERGFRHVFEADPEIGGRYSLSPFGLVPAALAGEAMLHRAQVAEQNCAQLDMGRPTRGSGSVP